MTDEIKNVEELEAKIKGLGNLDDETKKSIVCSLVGHSKIQTGFLGYWSCARCGDQLGDTLASTYDTSDIVAMGHKCEVCEKNFKKCTWRDTFMTPDPFADEEKTDGQ